MRIGVTELLIVLLIVILLWGPKQIPKLIQMGKKSIRRLRKSLDEE